MDNLDEIFSFLKNSIEKADIQSKIDDIRVAYLGKKGKITELLKNLSSINNLEEKKEFGKKINEIKNLENNLWICWKTFRPHKRRNL